MDSEISKIRSLRGLDEEFSDEPRRIDDDEVEPMAKSLNYSLKGAYEVLIQETFDIEKFANKIVENIYIILDKFNEMGVYPDYFYNEIVKMEIGYESLKKNNKDEFDKKDKRDFNRVYISVIKELKNVLGNKTYSPNGNSEKNISDAYVDMTKFLNTFNKSCGIQTIEQCKKALSYIQRKQDGLTTEFFNSYDLSGDIECLAKLLFEYIKVLAAIGINPKKLLDECIEEKNQITKGK